MYAVEGAIITAYPEPSRRGRMLSLWVFMRSAAPVSTYMHYLHPAYSI